MAPPVEEKTILAPCRFEDSRRADDVHVGVVVRSLDRDADVGLRGEVEDRLGADGVEDLVRVPDVGDVQLRRRGNPFARPLGEIVERVHVVTAREQRVHHVRADEAGTPRYDRPHPLVS